MKQNLIYSFFMILFFVVSSCDLVTENKLTVNVTHKGAPAKNVNIFVRDLFPIDDKMNGIEALTDAQGRAVISNLAEDVYEVWITSPGFEEIRQRLPIKRNDVITINTSLVRKSLPAEFTSIKAIGNFNNWDTYNSVVLSKDEKNIWQANIEFDETDTLVYMLYFDEPYLRYYNPESDSLLYLGGQQPSYQSIAYSRDENFQIFFDENEYERNETPYLNHWVEREIVGVNAQNFILFEKLMTKNYQQLSEILVQVNKLSENMDPTSEVDNRELISKLDALYNKPEISSILAEIEVFSENSDGELFDLSKIELAKINLVMGQNGKAKRLAEDVDFNSFAGGEAFNIVAMNFMKLPAGFAEYTRKKLAVISNPKARYVFFKKLVPAYYFLEEEEKLRMTIDMVLEEFPETSLAKKSKKLLQEIEENKKKEGL